MKIKKNFILFLALTLMTSSYAFAQSDLNSEIEKTIGDKKVIHLKDNRAAFNDLGQHSEVVGPYTIKVVLTRTSTSEPSKVKVKGKFSYPKTRCKSLSSGTVIGTCQDEDKEIINGKSNVENFAFSVDFSDALVLGGDEKQIVEVVISTESILSPNFSIDSVVISGDYSSKHDKSVSADSVDIFTLTMN